MGERIKVKKKINTEASVQHFKNNLTNSPSRIDNNDWVVFKLTKYLPNQLRILYQEVNWLAHKGDHLLSTLMTLVQKEEKQNAM